MVKTRRHAWRVTTNQLDLSQSIFMSKFNPDPLYLIKIGVGLKKEWVKSRGLSATANKEESVSSSARDTNFSLTLQALISSVI